MDGLNRAIFRCEQNVLFSLGATGLFLSIISIIIDDLVTLYLSMTVSIPVCIWVLGLSYYMKRFLINAFPEFDCPMCRKRMAFDLPFGKSKFCIKCGKFSIEGRLMISRELI